MALIEPNTLVSFVWGAHFYGTAHPGSDYDIVNVVVQDIDDYLSGRKYKPKQKHEAQWFGNSDYTRYEVAHFLGLIGKGNIQLIELVLEYDPQYTIYYSNIWKDLYNKIWDYAKHSLSQTNWGHIKGWMHKTMKKVETQGMTVKRAMLMWRMIIEARFFMKTGVLVCKWPDIINGASYDHVEDLKTLYEARLAGRQLSEKFLLKVEADINHQLELIDIAFDEYEPKKDVNLIHENQHLQWEIRARQIAEKPRSWWTD